MVNPVTPARASSPVPPPVPGWPIVDQRGFPTPAFAQFLQILWASIQGTGGVIDLTTQNIFQESPSFSPDTAAGREPIFAEMPDSKYTDLYRRVSNAELLAAFGPVSSSRVTDIRGTANEIIVSTAAGVYTLSTPQAIGTTSNVQFGLVDPTDIVGTITNDSAAAGNVGEYVHSEVVSGSAVALVTATPKTVTSISLTAGDWDVDGVIVVTGAATTSLGFFIGSLSLVDNNLGTNGESGLFETWYNNEVFFATTDVSQVTGTRRFSLAVTTTVYLVALVSFGVSTCSAYGQVRARRVR